MSKKRQRDRVLIDAVLMDDIAAVHRLLGDGADVNARDREHGETALMLARSEKMARMLVEAGADIHARDNAYGRTPFLKTGYRFLLDLGADINARDKEGQTKLMYAVQSADIDQVRRLVEWGADITLEDDSGETALSIAQAWGLLGIQEYLRSVGAKEIAPAIDLIPDEN
jgi:ankyrin repeat protein